MNQEPQKPIPLAKMQILAVALHFSILIYVSIAFFLATSSPDWVMGWTLKEEYRILAYVLIAVSIAAGALALSIPKIMKNTPPQRMTPYDAAESPLFFDFSNITRRIQTLTILRMALAESIVLYGLILSILNQALYWVLPFAAVGLLLQILVGPFGRFLRGI